MAKKTLLIYNKRSGSAAALDEEAVFNALHGGGFQTTATIILPYQDIPDRDQIVAAGFDAIAIISGDGTIASTYTAMAGWDGELLVLPGGTMNLLSKRLHGDRPVPDLLAALEKGGTQAQTTTVIRTEDGDVLTGLTCGSTTEWGTVREDLRQGNVEDILAKVPEAWTKTTENHSVFIEGSDKLYPSIFVEPVNSGKLNVTGIRADGARDMLAHGVAWLKRDFREGPRDELGEMDTVTIIDESDDRLGLLIDGEPGEGKSPLRCEAAQSYVKFTVIG